MMSVIILTRRRKRLTMDMAALKSVSLIAWPLVSINQAASQASETDVCDHTSGTDGAGSALTMAKMTIFGFEFQPLSHPIFHILVLYKSGCAIPKRMSRGMRKRSSSVMRGTQALFPTGHRL